MKKLIIFLILAMVFAVSCSSSKKTENDDNAILDEDTATTDEDSDLDDEVNVDEDETDDEEPDEDADHDEDNPCVPNPCENMDYSTGKCNLSYNWLYGYEYKCECVENAVWHGINNYCYDPCNPNPCENIAHSNGECTARESLIGDDAYCGCIDGYYWDDDRYKCTSSSEEKEECADFQNPDSDGI